MIYGIKCLFQIQEYCTNFNPLSSDRLIFSNNKQVAVSVEYCSYV